MDAKLVALLAFLLPSTTPPAPSAPALITPAELRAHIAVLASDAFEGRAPGTPGGAKTERYLVDQFRRAGLKPGMNGGWLQPVALVRRTGGRFTMRVSASGRSVAISPEELFGIGRGPFERVARAPLVFVGHAISTETGRDDLSGVNLNGAVALMLGENSPAGTGPISERRRLLAARGAAAVVVIAGANQPWPQLRASFAEGRTSLADAAMARIEGFVSPAGAARLLAATGADYDALALEAGRAEFRARPIGAAELDATSTVRRFRGDNVVGMVPGSSARGQAVVLTAHWDHLGLCRPPGAPDRICNGAVDNASGTAALIEIARRIARGPAPGRNVYFVATTGEELGLLGAHVFAGNPPFARSGLVADLNLDTIAGAGPGSPVGIIGRGQHPKLDGVIDAVIREAGRQVDEDEDANSFIQRQDGWEFTRLGVPAAMVGGAFSDLDALQTYLSGDYHKPSDDLAHLPALDGAAADASLHVALVRALADPRRYAP